MQALFFISTFLGLYSLLGIFFPHAMFFFLPEKCRRRSLAVCLTIIFVLAAIVFFSISPAAQCTGI